MCTATIIDGYVKMLDNLSAAHKLDIISRLSASVKSDLDNQSSFKEAFGQFDSNKTADEIITEIRDSRVFTREIESF